MAFRNTLGILDIYHIGAAETIPASVIAQLDKVLDRTDWLGKPNYVLKEMTEQRVGDLQEHGDKGFIFGIGAPNVVIGRQVAEACIGLFLELRVPVEAILNGVSVRANAETFASLLNLEYEKASRALGATYADAPSPEFLNARLADNASGKSAYCDFSIATAEASHKGLIAYNERQTNPAKQQEFLDAITSVLGNTGKNNQPIRGSLATQLGENSQPKTS